MLLGACVEAPAAPESVVLAGFEFSALVFCVEVAALVVAELGRATTS